MLHSLRISIIGWLVVGLVCPPLLYQNTAVAGDAADYYLQRQAVLASQLLRLRGRHAEVPEASDNDCVKAGGDMPDVAAAMAQRKTALVAASLESLVATQRGEGPVARQQRVTFNRLEDVAVVPDVRLGGERHAVLQIDALDEPSDEPDEDAVSADSRDVEDAPRRAPIPPAPRVQTSDEVREANVSLVTQMRNLMRLYSSGADPFSSAGLDAVPGAEASEMSSAPPVSLPATVSGSEPVAEDASPVMADKPEALPLPAPVSVEPSVRADVPALASAPVVASPAPAALRQRPVYDGDPMEQLVSIDFRDTDLTHVVAILALKAGINIIGGADLRGVVTANLNQVPLRVAMQTVLRMNGLGLVEEEGIYFIVPYEEAASVNRKTTMITLDKADVKDVKRILDDMVTGVRDEALISVSANETANTLVISAPKNRVDELVALAHQLDVSEPILMTVTEAISLNYSEPADIMPLVEGMLTDKIGQVAGDKRARHLVVTDAPIVVEQVKALVKTLDIPTKQVLIETMVVDAVLSDEADTGVQWLIESVRRMARRQAVLGDNGRAVGNLQELSLLSDIEALRDPSGLMSFGVLTDKIDWRGIIQMEVRNRNGRLVSNPVLLTVENETAEISISQEIPYVELTQTAAGGQQTSTQFKDVGTVLSVTPRVTHDNTIICNIDGKESTTSGTFEGIPIEDKRSIQTTMRMANGQTIFIGGLRKSDANTTVTKIPVLGDIPVVNFLFRANQRREQINELLVFLTCTVIEDATPELTPYQQEVFENAPVIVPRVDAWETVMYDTVHPKESRNMQHHWRRGS